LILELAIIGLFQRMTTKKRTIEIRINPEYGFEYRGRKK